MDDGVGGTLRRDFGRLYLSHIALSCYLLVIYSAYHEMELLYFLMFINKELCGQTFHDQTPSDDHFMEYEAEKLTQSRDSNILTKGAFGLPLNDHFPPLMAIFSKYK